MNIVLIIFCVLAALGLVGCIVKDNSITTWAQVWTFIGSVVFGITWMVG